MSFEPFPKRAIAFIDGQNLFHAAKEAFGYTYPNFDTLSLATAVCTGNGWEVKEVRFYTGIPDARDNPFWNHFWMTKLAVMGTQGVRTYSRPLRYRNQTTQLPDGSTTTVLVGQEKGIDVRIALDVLRLGLDATYDVAVVFSQDQDLSEAADELRSIARMQGRWLKIASAFPMSPASRNRRGINSTDWITIDRTLYDAHLDGNDYRPTS